MANGLLLDAEQALMAQQARVARMAGMLREIRSGNCPAQYPMTDAGLVKCHVRLADEALILPIHNNELLEYIASEIDRIAADFERRGLYGAKPLRHEAIEKRALKSAVNASGKQNSGA